MKLRDIGEFGLIERLRARLPIRAGTVLGIGDDAAVLAALSTPVVTCDALIEGVHFRRDWTSAQRLGRKAMAVNLSDLAAMGAAPVAAFVALGVCPALADSENGLTWLDELYDGFAESAEEYDFTLAGGDTVRTGSEMMISVTLIGETSQQARAAGAPLLRGGARPGDDLLVTGTLGDSAAGLFLLQHPEVQVSPATREYLVRRHLEPTPRLQEIQIALSAGSESTPLHAALDLSDGLAGDAGHLAARSQVQVEIDIARLPISPACFEAAEAASTHGFDIRAEDWVLRGGEDYELAMAVSPAASKALALAVQSATGTKVTVVGCCREAAAPTVVLVGADGKTKDAPPAWRHF